MGRHLTITIASIFALAIAGCSGDEEPQNTSEPTPTETAENNQSENTEPFTDPVVPAKTDKNTVAQAPANLIQPTNPTERVGVVSKGRSDPFDEIIPPVNYTIKSTEESTVNNRSSNNAISNNGNISNNSNFSSNGNTARNVGNSNNARNNTRASNRKRVVPPLPPLPASSRTTASRRRPRRSAVISATAGGNGGNGVTNRNVGRNSNNRNSVAKNSNPGRTALNPGTKPTPTKANSNADNRANTPVVPKVMPGVIPEPDLASVLPPPPTPELAQTVLVSGVIQVGNKPQAIIKVPTEPTSRYVQAGQRLASGLLVKRIEMNEGSEPIVILEQYGIEVARMVGESPTGATEPNTASTDNSVSKLPLLPKSASVGAS